MWRRNAWSIESAGQGPPKRLACSGKPSRRQELALGLDEEPADDDERQEEVQSWPMVLLNPKAVPPVPSPPKEEEEEEEEQEEPAAEPEPSPPREQHFQEQQAQGPPPDAPQPPSTEQEPEASTGEPCEEEEGEEDIHHIRCFVGAVQVALRGCGSYAMFGQARTTGRSTRQSHSDCSSSSSCSSHSPSRWSGNHCHSSGRSWRTWPGSPRHPSTRPRRPAYQDGRHGRAIGSSLLAKDVALAKHLRPKVEPKDLRERLRRLLKKPPKPRGSSTASPASWAKLSPKPPSEPPPKWVREAYRRKKEGSQMPPPWVPRFHWKQEQKDLKKPRFVLVRGCGKQQPQRQQQQLSPKEGLTRTPKPPSEPPPWLKQETTKKQSKEEKGDDEDGGLWSLAWAAFRVVDVPIHKVYFGQRSVKWQFKDGSRFCDLITHLNNGTCHYTDESLILDVARVGKSGYLTLDNRRLLCLKRSNCTKVRCRIIGVFPDRASYLKICSHADGVFRAPRVRRPDDGGEERLHIPPRRKLGGESEADDTRSDRTPSSTPHQKSTTSSVQGPIKPIGMSIRKWTAVKRRRLQ